MERVRQSLRGRFHSWQWSHLVWVAATMLQRCSSYLLPIKTWLSHSNPPELSQRYQSIPSVTAARTWPHLRTTTAPCHCPSAVASQSIDMTFAWLADQFLIPTQTQETRIVRFHAAACCPLLRQRALVPPCRRSERRSGRSLHKKVEQHSVRRWSVPKHFYQNNIYSHSW